MLPIAIASPKTFTLVCVTASVIWGLTIVENASVVFSAIEMSKFSAMVVFSGNLIFFLFAHNSIVIF